MDETWGYYIKWEESITKRQTQYDNTYMSYLEKSNSENLLVTSIVSFSQDKRVLEIGCNTIKMHLTLINYTYING